MRALAGWVLVGLLIALVGGGAGLAQSDRRVTFRIFDPTGHLRTQVTLAGLRRNKTTAEKVHGQTELLLVLTRAGERDFCKLTRALAHRGARLHNHHEQQAIAINGHIYSRPYIDYRYFPNGLCGSAFVTMTGVPPATARRLAHLLRG